MFPSSHVWPPVEGAYHLPSPQSSVQIVLVVVVAAIQVKPG